jgi:hypothetical protein
VSKRCGVDSFAGESFPAYRQAGLAYFSFADKEKYEEGNCLKEEIKTADAPLQKRNDRSGKFLFFLAKKALFRVE